MEDLPGVEALQEPGRLPLSYFCLPVDVVDLKNSMVVQAMYLSFIAVLVMSVLFYALCLMDIFI